MSNAPDRADRLNKEILEIRKQRDADYEQYKAAGRIWGLVPRERISRITFPRLPESVLDTFRGMEDLSTTVSDILDGYGIKGSVSTSYLKPIIPGKVIVGHAVTIRNIPVRKTVTKGALDKDFIAMATRDIYYLAENGDILVTDYAGNLDVSNMGGQSCAVAKSCGLSGSVVNGAARDISTIRRLDYPVWSCGTTSMTGKFRMECIEMNGPISLCGLLVMPGDLIIADDSGVCVVPYDLGEKVLGECKAILDSEEHMREMIDAKVPIEELRPFYRKRYS